MKKVKCKIQSGKKLLSLILAVLVVISCAGTQIFSILADSVSVTPGFIYDFTDEGNQANAIIDTSTTERTYDANLGVIKLTSKNTSASAPIMFRVAPGRGTSVDDYPIIAIRVKLTDTAVKYSQTYAKSTADTASSLFVHKLSGASYQATTSWQTVIIDSSNITSSEFANDWYVVGFWLAQAETVTSSSAVYVQWAGAFASVADANSYAEKNTLETSGSSVKTGFVYDFTDESNLSYAAIAYNNAVTSYDSEKGVMKVVAKDVSAENPMTFVVEPNRNGQTASVTEYPIVAIRVKITSTDMKYVGTWFNGTGLATGEGTNNSWWTCNLQNNSYTQTTAWQTLIIDTSNYYSGSWPNRCFFENWYSVAFKLAAQGTVTADDAAYVQWVASFKSVADAQQYAKDTALPDEETVAGFVYDFTKQDTLSSAIPVNGNTNVEYDETESVMKVTAKDAAAANPMQFVLEPSSKTTSVEDYPVIAIRVRLTNTATKYSATFFDGSGLGRDENANSWWRCSISDTSYAANTRWQTLIIDTSDYYSASWPNRCFLDNWFSIAFKLAADGSVAANDAVYVQWAGVFASVSDAKQYADEHDLNSSESDVQAGFMYDFTDSTKTSEAIAAYNNAEITYDETEGAIKVTAKDTSAENPMTIVVQPQTASVTEYPILAIRVKRPASGTAYAGAWFNGTGLATGENSNSWWTCSITDNAYVDTADWHTIIIDTSDYYEVGQTGLWPNRAFIGDWYSAAFKLATAGTVKADDAAYVQWIGAFKTVEDAAQYGIDFSLNSGTEPDYNYNLADPDSATYKVGEKITNGYLFDFDSQEDVDILVSDMKSILTFDKNESALKLQVSQFGAEKNGRTSAYWNTAYNGKPVEFPTLSTSEYGVYVMRVKTSEGAKGISMSLPACVKYDGKYVANWSDNSQRAGWITSTEWQYVYFTFDASLYSKIEGIYIDPLRYSKLGEYALVDYIAVFTDMTAALAYTGETPGENTKNEYSSPFFFSYETEQDFKDDVASGVMAATANAYVKYDSTEQAMRISPNTVGTTNSFTLKFNPEGDFDVNSEYKVYAALVKISNPEKMNLTGVYFSTDYYMKNRPETMTNTYNAWQSTFADYQKNSEWQIIYWDTSNEVSNWWKGNLTTSLLVLAEQNYIAAENDSICVRFYGAFKSVDDVFSYASRYGKFTKAPGTGIEGAEKLFYDFKSDADVSKVTATGNNTVVSYNAKMKAMKVEAIDTTAAAACQIRVTPKVAADVTEYPVIALRVKLPRENLKFGGFVWRTSNYAKQYGENTAKGISMTWFVGFPAFSLNYENTTEWQTIVIDGSNYPTDRFTGIWTDMIIQLVNSGEGQSGLEPGDAIYIDWLGAFDSVASVNKYLGLAVDTSTANGPTKLFFDFNSKTYVDGTVEAIGDTAVSYSSVNDALKVEVKDTDGDGYTVTTPGRIELGTKSAIEKGITVEDYPYIAMRVKIANTNTIGGDFYARTSGTLTATSNGMLTSADMMIDTIEYKETEEWQTVIFNCLEDSTLQYFLNGDWKKLVFDTVSESVAVEGTTVYIDWIGGFTSYDGVIAFAGEDKTTTVSVIKNDKSNDKDTLSSGKLPTAAVVGIVVGAAVVVLAGIAVAFIVIKRRKKQA